MTSLVWLLLGALIGACAVLFLARTLYLAPRIALTVERDLLRERVEELGRDHQEERRTADLLAPLGQTLQRMERQVGVLERDRVEQYGELGARLDQVGSATAVLRRETATLAGALTSSTVAGTWGETQLRRVLEHAGMLSRCDFEEQAGAHTREGAAVRPDVVVRLPGERRLVIDSKAPVATYLAAYADGLSEDERVAARAAHAASLARHLDALAAKSYWSAFAQTPEMVIAFVPSDAMLSAALRADPGLFERAMGRKVVLASPSTLLALLRTVALGWQQDQLSANAQELLELGHTLYERLATLGRHADKLGTSLRRSVESYNALLGTLESRVLVTARRMHELGLADAPPAVHAPVDQPVRPLTAAELIDRLDEDTARPMLDFRTSGGPDSPGEHMSGQRSEPAS